MFAYISYIRTKASLNFYFYLIISGKNQNSISTSKSVSLCKNLLISVSSATIPNLPVRAKMSMGTTVQSIKKFQSSQSITQEEPNELVWVLNFSKNQQERLRCRLKFWNLLRNMNVSNYFRSRRRHFRAYFS